MNVSAFPCQRCGLFVSARRALAVFALAFGLAAHAAAQSTPLVIPPQPFNERIGPCRDVRVAALGRETLAVGWTVAEGPQQGVYLRWRLHYLVEPPMRVATAATTAPRDLAMAFDAGGRLHLVWTALGNGGARELRHARVDQPGQIPTLARTLSAPTDLAATAGGDVDFPTLKADAAGGIVVAWQQSRGVRYSIPAVRIDPQGEPHSLGIVSGGSPSGLNPQILTTDPPRIAWYEIDEFAGNVRVEEWRADEGRWRPSAWEAPARLFDAFGQVQLHATPAGDGLIGCWQQAGVDGRAMLVVGRPKAQIDPAAGDPPMELDVFSEPAGEHSSPSLALGDPATLAWQVFADGGQAILVAPLFAGQGRPRPLMLSKTGQRFASLPDQATVDRWSVVAWIDDARDGGDGNVYLAEVTWPNGGS